MLTHLPESYVDETSITIPGLSNAFKRLAGGFGK
jgi:hypothetical protein